MQYVFREEKRDQGDKKSRSGLDDDEVGAQCPHQLRPSPLASEASPRNPRI